MSKGYLLTQANAGFAFWWFDSSTVLAMAQQQNFNCYALSFHYGQRSQAELTAAKRVAMRCKRRSTDEHRFRPVWRLTLTTVTLPFLMPYD